MKNFARSIALSLSFALHLAACAPGVGPSEAESTVQAGTVVGRVETEATAEVVQYQYSLAVRGAGSLLQPFEQAAVNGLPGAVLISQSDSTNALRRRIAEGLVAVSPRTGRHYYNAEGVASGEAILRDLANPTPELVTVTFSVSAEGERVSITCLGGQPPYARVFTPAELRDPAACVGVLLDEVRRQVEVYRGGQP